MHLASKYYIIVLLAELYSISKTSHFHRENFRHWRDTHLDKENVLRETSERGSKLRARWGLIWRQKVRKILGAILRVMSENPATDIWKRTGNNKKQETLWTQPPSLGLSNRLEFIPNTEPALGQRKPKILDALKLTWTAGFDTGIIDCGGVVTDLFDVFVSAHVKLFF